MNETVRVETEPVDDEQLIARFRAWPIDRDTAFRYRGYLSHELLVKRCRACGALHEPPGPVCPSCWAGDVEAFAVAGTGTIHTAIFLRQGPPADGVDYSTPYPVVTVALDEQPSVRITSTVVGSPQSAIVVGARVRVDWAERSGAPYPVFRLVHAENEVAR